MSHFRPLRSDQIQSPNDPARVQAKRAEGSIAAAIIRAMRDFASTIDPGVVTALLATNDFAGLWDHLAVERIGHALRPALTRLADVHDKVATTEMALITAPRITKAALSTLRTPDVIRLGYDALDEVTIAAQRRARDAVIGRIEATTEATAQQVLAQGLKQGLTAAEISRNMQATLGMSLGESNAVLNYRRSLEIGDTSTLRNQLRDRRFDGSVKRAASSGQPLDPEAVDRMTTRYAERYQASRAMRTARTESMQAANAGKRDAWRQYADRTDAAPDQIRRFWLTSGLEGVCEVCRAIPGMNPDGVPLDGTYDTPDGDGEPGEIHPNCMCSERITNVADEIPADTGPGVGLRILLDYAA